MSASAPSPSVPQHPAGRPEAHALDGRARAIARLGASRQRLEATWLPPSDSGRPSGRAAGEARAEGRWRDWSARLSEVPVVGSVFAAASRWWERHPWRLTGHAVAAEWDEAVRPWVRRHPVLVLAAAGAVGFAIVAARPWTWPGVAEQVRPLPRRAGRWLMRQLSEAPLQAMLAGLVVAGQVPAAAARAAPDADAKTPDERRP